jgi:hypothetical protein
LPLKADPFAYAAERPPATASIVHGRPEYDWHDGVWMEKRRLAAPRYMPISIYECHLGSWARIPEDRNRYLTYRELAERLVPYVSDMGSAALSDDASERCRNRRNHERVSARVKDHAQATCCSVRVWQARWRSLGCDAAENLGVHILSN